MDGYYPDLVEALDPASPGAACAGRGLGGGVASVARGRFGPGSGYCGTSFGAVQCADSYLASLPANLSVIHFNWGLHDICPSIYADVSFAEYEKNLEAVYFKFKRRLAPGGTLVFATTTPVPPS